MTLPASIAAKVSALGIDPSDPNLRAHIEAALRQRCEAQVTDRKRFDKLSRAFPLARSVLWRAPSAPCDQRRSVIAALTSPVVTLVLGGERSGKSLGMKQLTLAMALGGDHPVVRAWLDLNDLPRDRIPNGPAEVYAVALTSNDSIRYHRPSFDELLGHLPHTWHNKTGNGESRLVFDVPGYSKPGIIHFKSIDQKARSFQGISLRWAWIDEEPLGHDGKAVYGQCRARVMDQDGRIGISMVPMDGYTWVYYDLVRDRKDHAVPIELDPMDNPHLPKERAESHYGSFSGDELAMRRYGRFRARSGAIYPLWNVGDNTREGSGHVCAPFDIPDHWVRFRGVDFGLDNPTAVVWGALGDDEVLYIFREYYRPKGLSYPWHAERVAAIERGCTVTEDEIIGEPGEFEPIECGWGDPASLEGREAFAQANIPVARADNDLQRGYDAVRDRLRLRGDMRPRLKVFSTCTHTIEELGGLIKDDKRVDLVQLKRDDHAADAVRYLVSGVRDWLGL